MNAEMYRLQAELQSARRVLRQTEDGGKVTERIAAESRLSGLLTAWAILGGEVADCLHPTHNADGLDERGETIWRCTVCQKVYER